MSTTEEADLAHAAGSEQVYAAARQAQRRLPNFLSPRRLHDLERMRLQETRGREVVRMILVGDADGRHAPRVFQHRIEVDAIVSTANEVQCAVDSHGARIGFEPRFQVRPSGAVAAGCASAQIARIGPMRASMPPPP